MALAAVDAGQTILAVQLLVGQVHSERMDMTPALDHVKNAQSAKGKPVVRIEGSASDGPSTRAGGNLNLPRLVRWTFTSVLVNVEQSRIGKGA